jgi:hypothetical protein
LPDQVIRKHAKCGGIRPRIPHIFFTLHEHLYGTAGVRQIKLSFADEIVVDRCPYFRATVYGATVNIP